MYILWTKCNKTHRIHVEVAKAFIPNPNNYPCINHTDGNKTHNNTGVFPLQSF